MDAELAPAHPERNIHGTFCYHWLAVLASDGDDGPVRAVYDPLVAHPGGRGTGDERRAHNAAAPIGTPAQSGVAM